ncbi:anti-phage dCTP deaminase [Rhizobium rosettiformans]|uniref:anti-phage dCTP deaminase n=1 Tax=Rhizobium rosettiformans TaxID=1368430 RepID=UPI0028557C66|nr:anti-phage dCTP deaminase [Rhizobium rosettiformans]MDR7027715.1 deoxycytidylate deaminase [Rhizobium rosettiformans]MDR7066279.1 deoxycytidylate deaminase [Rhizobium rosettiformans]
MATKEFQTSDNILPEIVIGIVSPVGTSLDATVSSLRDQFQKKKFAFNHIKISHLFPAVADSLKYSGLNSRKKHERIDSYIKFGNYVRDNIGSKVWSLFAMSEISSARSNRKENAEGVAFVIDQLKTEDELNALREIYGNRFFQISVYSARDVRVDNLSKSIARDHNRRDGNKYRGIAEELVVRDEDELGEPNGQKVGKIFQYADVVVNDDRTESGVSVPDQIEKFVDLLFGHNGYSPNHLEYGMYLAHSAALRSLDLSRQVGAAIFRPTGEIAALGSNEVPKAGGGTYWCDDPVDAREYTLGHDSNDVRKQELLNEIIQIISPDAPLSDEKIAQLDKSQFMDALEYGRIVHAEMSAISDAARLGIGIQGGTIFCTTFPCHMCSKHIVSSGLTKVVFLEPYPKSLTSDLHPDSVKIEGTTRGSFAKFSAVEFVPFFGITPRRYREFFSRGKRKKDGIFQSYSDGHPRLMMSNSGPVYARREAEAIDVLLDALTKFQQRNADLKNQKKKN